MFEFCLLSLLLLFQKYYFCLQSWNSVVDCCFDNYPFFCSLQAQSQSQASSINISQRAIDMTTVWCNRVWIPSVWVSPAPVWWHTDSPAQSMWGWQSLGSFNELGKTEWDLSTSQLDHCRRKLGITQKDGWTRITSCYLLKIFPSVKLQT